jgi:hypothetical protein
MANLIPVDYNPFMGAASAAPKLIPVDYDPFGDTPPAAPKLVPVDYDPFAAPPSAAGAGATGPGLQGASRDAIVSNPGPTPAVAGVGDGFLPNPFPFSTTLSDPWLTGRSTPLGGASGSSYQTLAAPGGLPGWPAPSQGGLTNAAGDPSVPPWAADRSLLGAIARFEAPPPPAAYTSLVGGIPRLWKPLNAETDSLVALAAGPPDASAASDPPPAPMPGMFGALSQGLGASVRDLAVTATSAFSPPNVANDDSPAAAPFGWSDLGSPFGQLGPKAAYRLGRSFPTLAGGVAGGVIGGGIGSPVGPEGTAAGALIGGSLGAAAVSAAQTLGPAYAAELQKTPNDQEGAWQRAWTQAAISGVFSGAAWALFPARFFQGPVKQLVFQAFGVQPAVSVAEKATRNILEGRPAQEGLGEAYGEGVVGTLTPALGHAAVRVLGRNIGAGRNDNTSNQLRDSSSKPEDVETRNGWDNLLSPATFEATAPTQRATDVVARNNTDPGLEASAGWTPPPLITGSYRSLSGALPPGWQANHINQKAAYREKIPWRDALAVAMPGDVIVDPGSGHHAFHWSLEQWWEPYREDNELYGTFPTNAEYGEAAKRAFVVGGFTQAQASQLAAQGAAERAAHGLDEGASVPRIPGRINWPKRR